VSRLIKISESRVLALRPFFEPQRTVSSMVTIATLDRAESRRPTSLLNPRPLPAAMFPGSG